MGVWGMGGGLQVLASRTCIHGKGWVGGGVDGEGLQQVLEACESCVKAGAGATEVEGRHGVKKRMEAPEAKEGVPALVVLCRGWGLLSVCGVVWGWMCWGMWSSPCVLDCVHVGGCMGGAFGCVLVTHRRELVNKVYSLHHFEPFGNNSSLEAVDGAGAYRR